MSKCKACGADIIWIKTLGGKAMPCDATAVKYHPAIKGKDKLVRPDGVMDSGIITQDKNGEVGYIPHWATCPAADQFRKEKR